MSFQRYSLSFFIISVLAIGPTLAAERDTERRAVLFYTGEVHGTIEPCGCTSDPLGDIARVTAIIRRASRTTKNVLFVDAGNLSFPPSSTDPVKRAAAMLRGEFIGEEFERLPLVGSAIGQADLSPEGKILPPRRLATNVEANVQVDSSRMAEAGGIRFGILGYIEPQIAKTLGWVPRDATKAILEATTRLRAEGADVVVLLAPIDRPAARTLARNLDLDFIVLGKDVGDGLARAERVGNTYFLAPSEETQRLGRLEIVLSNQKETGVRLILTDAGGAEHNRTRAADLLKQESRLHGDLQRWKADSTADTAFVAAKTAEFESLQKEIKQLQENPWTPPREGSYFTNSLIPIKHLLPRDPALARGMRKLDEAIAAIGLKLAEPPPPAEAGQARYIGDAKCISCHNAAARSFATTRHAQAWATLVNTKKTGQADCVSCHVTGYGEMGGSSFGFTKGLENVQCEACHGPGSIHVEKRGKETPFAGLLKTPESLCIRCHNEKHSDTFQYEAYLRDVLGPGHGEDARDALGKGPTGKELRRAAKKRAKQM